MVSGTRGLKFSSSLSPFDTILIVLVFTVSYVTTAVSLFVFVPHHSPETTVFSLLFLCPLNSAVKNEERAVVLALLSAASLTLHSYHQTQR